MSALVQNGDHNCQLQNFLSDTLCTWTDRKSQHFHHRHQDLLLNQYLNPHNLQRYEISLIKGRRRSLEERRHIYSCPTFISAFIIITRSNTYLVCHFFTQAKFLENKIYTKKRVYYDKLHSKLPILRVNYDKLHSKLPIFRVKSVKIYTGQFFLNRHRVRCL